MSETEQKQATPQEIERAIHPESAVSRVRVGGREVSVTLLKRRWEKLFDQAALPVYQKVFSGHESALKSIADGSWLYNNLSGALLEAVIDSDKDLDRAAAVVLAAQVPGAKDDPEAEILRQIDWLQDNSRSEEILNLVEAQIEKEDLLRRVGERLPARFAQILHLAGVEISEDSVRQHLTNLSQKLQAMSIGAGE